MLVLIYTIRQTTWLQEMLLCTGERNYQFRRYHAAFLSVNDDSSVFWAQRKSSMRYDIYKSIRDRLAVPKQKVVVWIVQVLSSLSLEKYPTASHLVIWKPWPAAGHVATLLHGFYILILRHRHD